MFVKGLGHLKLHPTNGSHDYNCHFNANELKVTLGDSDSDRVVKKFITKMLLRIIGNLGWIITLA